MMFTEAEKDALDLRLAVSDDVVSDYPIKVRCREHNDKTRGNLAVYRDHLHCFACGWHEARPMAALAYLLRVDLDAAIKVASRYTGAALDGYRERTALETRTDPLPGSLANIYHNVLIQQRHHRLQWLFDRGLTLATLMRFQVGHDGMRYTIPIHDREARLVSLRYRRDEMYCDESSAKYLGMKGRNGRYLYSELELAQRQPEWVVVCEGEFDCMRLWQEGIPAVTVTNGAGQLQSIPGLLKAGFPSIRTLIVAGDMDEPGRAASQVTKQLAESLGFEAQVLSWSVGKDISEALLADATLPAQIRSMVP